MNWRLEFESTYAKCAICAIYDMSGGLAIRQKYHVEGIVRAGHTASICTIPQKTNCGIANKNAIADKDYSGTFSYILTFRYGWVIFSIWS